MCARMENIIQRNATRRLEVGLKALTHDVLCHYFKFAVMFDEHIANCCDVCRAYRNRHIGICNDGRNK